MSQSSEKTLEQAFLNPFGEVEEVPDLNNMPEIEVVWQHKWSSWPIPQVDVSIEAREMVLKIGHRHYLWKRAWWNKAILKDSIASMPNELASRLFASKPAEVIPPPPREELQHLFVSNELLRTRSHIGQSTIPTKLELVADLDEISSCMKVGAHRAVLALAGRCLEIVLKTGLRLRKLPYNEDWMVGRLLTEYEAQGVYLDPSLKNSYNILNLHRVHAVHFKEPAEVPSREQAVAIIFTLIDTVNRCLSERLDAAPLTLLRDLAGFSNCTTSTEATPTARKADIQGHRDPLSTKMLRNPAVA